MRATDLSWMPNRGARFSQTGPPIQDGDLPANSDYQDTGQTAAGKPTTAEEALWMALA